MSDAAESKPGATTPDIEAKRRKHRNLAVAGGIAVFIILIYFVTLMRIGAGAPGAAG